MYQTSVFFVTLILIISDWGTDLPLCPDCASVTSLKDYRERIIRFPSGDTGYVTIRRVTCPKCHHTHTELPACLIPHKHYCIEAIELVLSDDDSVPCDMKSRTRWNEWFSSYKAQLIQHWKDLAAFLPEIPAAHLLSPDSVLLYCRTHHLSWLHLFTSALPPALP